MLARIFAVVREIAGEEYEVRLRFERVDRLDGALERRGAERIGRTVEANVGVAELEETDLWQRATIGVVAISSSKDYLQGQIQLIEKQAVRIANDNGAEVVDVIVEYL